MTAGLSRGSLPSGADAAKPGPANRLTGAFPAPASVDPAVNHLAAVPTLPAMPATSMNLLTGQPAATLAQDADPSVPASAVQPPATSDRVAAYGTALQGMNLTPDQLAQEAARGEAMRQLIAPLARKGDATHAEVLDAITGAVKDGTLPAADATKALAAVPQDKAALAGWLNDRHHAVVGMLVHVHGALGVKR